jgi:hypothetical protein
MLQFQCLNGIEKAGYLKELGEKRCRQGQGDYHPFKRNRFASDRQPVKKQGIDAPKR